MTALIDVIARTKLKTSAAAMAGRSNGRITLRTVVKLLAPSVSDASSRFLSSWLMAAMPARSPTGMFRNMKHMTRIMRYR